MKKVFLYAYDQKNLGDDLFIQTITNRYQDVKFYMWSTVDNRITFSQLNNLVIMKKESIWLRFLNMIRPSIAVRFKGNKEKKCDAVVYIGGSIFIEYETWENILKWWKNKALKNDFYVLGANFGPYHTEKFREGFKEIFPNLKDICFRDSYSQSLFANVDRVRCAPDILYSYPFKENESNEKQVFVSVIDCSSKDEGDNKLAGYEGPYIESIITLLTNLINKGYKIVLSSFCKAEGDEKAVEAIQRKLSPDMCTAVNYNGENAQEILNKINESSLIIASRFHATILGFAAGKPVLPVIYSEKTKHVLEDAGFKGKYMDIRSLKKIDIDSLLAHADNQKLLNIGELKRKAELHFVKLDKLLKADNLS